MRAIRRLQLTLAYAIVIIACIVFVLPILWLLIASLKPANDMYNVSLRTSPTLENFRNVMNTYPIGEYLGRSALVAAISTTISLTFGSLVAYAIARSRYAFTGVSVLTTTVIAIRIVPAIAISIPLYLLFTRAGLTNSPMGLALAHAGAQLPLVILIMQGFFREIPTELEDAGLTDGAGRLGVLRQIVLPLAAPGLAVAAILAFLASWNDFGTAIVLASGPDVKTMPVALAQMTEVYGIRWDLVSAGAALYIVPTIAIGFALQRFIVRGLTSGALKG